VRCVPRLAPNTALYSKRNKQVSDEEVRRLPYELIRRTGERAVADGKVTLASFKIATDSESYFAQSFFIPMSGSGDGQVATPEVI
jgi:hypothetical protein